MYERYPVEPDNEPEVDGYLICSECEKVIPGGSYYFDVSDALPCPRLRPYACFHPHSRNANSGPSPNPMIFCEECMNYWYRKIAPYASEEEEEE